MKALYRGGYLLTVAAAISLGGCATAARGTGGDPDVLTHAQIMSVPGVSNLYDVVKRLRPRWLQVRAGNRSIGMTTVIAVYQDNVYQGDTQALFQIQPDMVYEIRWMNGTRASDVLTGIPMGTHLAGAIMVSTHPPKGGRG